MANPLLTSTIDNNSITHVAHCRASGAERCDAGEIHSNGDATSTTAKKPSKSESVLRVLLIEDNLNDGRMVAHALQRARSKFHVSSVDCLSKARDLLRIESFDVILTDLSLPDSEGVASVVSLRQIAAGTPLVVLTGLSSDPVAMAALNLGAQDYLTKDAATSEVLEKTIRYAIQRQKNAGMRQLLKTMRANDRLLVRKNKRLARLNRTAHRFVDNVSHEFRSPLTVIMEYVSLMRDGIAGAVNEEQFGLLDIAMDRADDLNNMVNDMLDVSTLGAGMLGFRRCSSRIEAIVDHIRPNLEKKAAIRGVTLVLEIDPALPAVYCDPEKIGRVLINLAVNGIKFSGQPGHVRIHVAVDPLIPQVVVSVTDNGPGIDQKRLGELFKRFKQLGTASRGSTKGFGLGLNIAKELIHLNFGEISVQTKLGAGSTFSFTLPVNEPTGVTRRYLEQARNASREVSLLQLVVGTSAATADAEDADAFLNHLLRRHDLILRAAPDRWVLLLAASAAEVELFLARARKLLRQVNRNRPYGPLPTLSSHLVATWAIQGHAEEILKAVRTALDGVDTRTAVRLE